MAKKAYKPSSMLSDPLAALRQATEERAAEPEALEIAAAAEPQTMAERLASRFDNAQKAQGTVFVREEAPAPVPASAPSPVTTSTTTSIAPTKPIATTVNPTRNTVYLYPEDLTQLRQIAGWLATEHGIRANDSMIVRACLAMGDRDVRLLHAIKETALSDRRRTKK
jgi:hypothetical protein